MRRAVVVFVNERRSLLSKYQKNCYIYLLCHIFL